MSNAGKTPEIIIVKKIIKKNNAHHGGSWKIAYADFVTAMMAFFLLMWLLSMLNKYQLMGISNYFNKPLKNVFVVTKKNDTIEKKEPKEHSKKYKLQLIEQEKAPIDARSRGMEKNRTQPKNQTKSLNQNQELEHLKTGLEKELHENPTLKAYVDQVNINIVKDGLKISLHDLDNKPMFSLGEADFEAYAKPLLDWLSKEINQSRRKVTIIGHTDTTPYLNDSNYSNWELSADRANSTRRVLIKYGMSANNIIRVQGASDSVLLDKENGKDPKNRRIDIILLTDKAVNRLLED